MFWKRKEERRPVESDAILREAIAGALSEADPMTVDIVTAVTGLLAAIAYSDRQIEESEEQHLRSELGRINGFSAEHIEAVAQVLSEHALRLNTSFVPRLTRTLREHLDVAQRCEVLDACLGMAAADGVISYDEVTSLRNMSTALGLTQAHYNELQERHKDKLERT